MIDTHNKSITEILQLLQHLHLCFHLISFFFILSYFYYMISRIAVISAYLPPRKKRKYPLVLTDFLLRKKEQNQYLLIFTFLCAGIFPPKEKPIESIRRGRELSRIFPHFQEPNRTKEPVVHRSVIAWDRTFHRCDSGSRCR